MTLQALSTMSVAVLACGCAQSPEPLPEPPAVIVIDCRAPADMLSIDAEPAIPAGDYTQRDVARYVVQLASWGRAAAKRLQKVSAFSRHCGEQTDGS